MKSFLKLEKNEGVWNPVLFFYFYMKYMLHCSNLCVFFFFHCVVFFSC